MWGRRSRSVHRAIEPKVIVISCPYKELANKNDPPCLFIGPFGPCHSSAHFLISGRAVQTNHNPVRACAVLN